jgi:hypothetical protein
MEAFTSSGLTVLYVNTTRDSVRHGMIARSTAIHAATAELVEASVAEPAVEVKICCKSFFDIDDTAAEEASFIQTAMHSTVA